MKTFFILSAFILYEKRFRSSNSKKIFFRSSPSFQKKCFFHVAKVYVFECDFLTKKYFFLNFVSFARLLFCARWLFSKFSDSLSRSIFKKFLGLNRGPNYILVETNLWAQCCNLRNFTNNCNPAPTSGAGHESA